MQLGWISIHRKLCHSDLWLNEKFSRGQAWVDLLLLANHKKGCIRVAGEKINLERGQCGWSKLKLSHRWKWSLGKVTRFLKDLAKEEKIEVKTETRTTIITICNYSKYQLIDTTNSTTDRTTDGKQTETNNNDNNKNNDIYRQSFEEFWLEYPRQRRGDKEKSFKAYLVAIKKDLAENILAGVRRYAKSEEVAKGYGKGCAAWLNDSRWLNEYKAKELSPVEKELQRAKEGKFIC